MTDHEIRLASWRFFAAMLVTGIVYGLTFLFVDPTPGAPGDDAFAVGLNEAARVWHLFTSVAAVTFPVFASLCVRKHVRKLLWGMVLLTITPGYNLVVYAASHGLTYARGVSLPSGPHDAIAGIINVVGVALLFWCAVPQCFED